MKFENIASYSFGGGICGFYLARILSVWLDMPWMYTYAGLMAIAFSLLFYALAALTTPQYKKQRFLGWLVITIITSLFTFIALIVELVEPRKEMASVLAIVIIPFHVVFFSLFEFFINRASQRPPPHFGRPPNADTKPTSPS